MNKSPHAKDFAARREAAGRAGRIGVLLINLGTPDATSYWAMRRYLKEFLSDRRVIEVNRVLWWLVLHVIVLVKRPLASGAKYRSIWNEELNEFAAVHHHAQPGGEGRTRACREDECRGRLGDALRQSERRRSHRSVDLPGLRPAAGLPALSTIRRRQHGDG